MNNRNVRLTSRAFNNECEAAVANVRWNNVVAMEKRILRAKEQIDNLNASNGVVISDAYVDLKLAELRLTHEYREKQKAEREERAEAARLAREEQKLQRDLERAEEEEARYARLLERARRRHRRRSALSSRPTAPSLAVAGARSRRGACPHRAGAGVGRADPLRLRLRHLQHRLVRRGRGQDRLDPRRRPDRPGCANSATRASHSLSTCTP